MDVKGTVGWETSQIRTGCRATWQAVANMRTVEATKSSPRAKRIAGTLGVPSRCSFGEGLCRRRYLELIDVELPGVVGDGMSGKIGQQKPGTARGSPRHSRTAKASHISRRAVKLRCAREHGGWGRLSDDGRDSITRTGARAPGVGGAFHRVAVQYIASTDPTLGGSTLKHEGRRQTGTSDSVCREQA